MTSVTTTEDLERLHGAILDAWTRQDADDYARYFGRRDRGGLRRQ